MSINFDAFRQPDQNVLIRGSLTGALLSIFAFFSLLSLFFVEVSNLYSQELITELVVEDHETDLLRIHFDLTLLDIPCRYATINVIDQWSDDRHNVHANINKQPVRRSGSDVENWTPMKQDAIRCHSFRALKGCDGQDMSIRMPENDQACHKFIAPGEVGYCECENDIGMIPAPICDHQGYYCDNVCMHQFEYSQEEIAELEEKMLADDWSNRAEDVLHQTADHHASFLNWNENSGTPNEYRAQTRDAHFFVVETFYTGWCPACKSMLNVLENIHADTLANATSDLVDDSGMPVQVKFAAVNCQFHMDICREESIRRFPTTRFWHGQKQSANFEFAKIGAQVNYANVMEWIQNGLRGYNLHHNAEYHYQFNEGCRVSGFVDASRVPGQLIFGAHPLKKNFPKKIFG